jgi:hypothetical protein
MTSTVRVTLANQTAAATAKASPQTAPRAAAVTAAAITARRSYLWKMANANSKRATAASATATLNALVLCAVHVTAVIPKEGRMAVLLATRTETAMYVTKITS